MKSPLLVNAAQMQIEHPATFERPAADELNSVRPGSVVKVCDGRERFWVEVHVNNAKILTGRIVNMLLFSRLKFGDRIKFHTDNIFAISP